MCKINYKILPENRDHFGFPNFCFHIFVVVFFFMLMISPCNFLFIFFKFSFHQINPLLILQFLLIYN